MAKKSLLISENERYGNSPGGMLSSKPMDDKTRAKERAKPKYSPSIELTASQVKSFGLEDAKVGQTGCAMVHYIVKSCSSGSPYGDETPGKGTESKVCISLTHVDPDCEAPADDEEGGENDDEPDDTGGADEADSSDEEAEDDDSKPKAPTKDTLSPSAALGEED